MDIHAIHTAFALGCALADRAADRNERRLDHIRHRRTLLAIHPGPLLVCHAVPVLSLSRPEACPVEQL
ncbi:hypothetical protein B0G80_4931 [Paraburkholderia sp. BL6669N2]|nr:hypothetical protein B0G80_4931 [Paraburkholderia sp. BL6669N2]